MSITINREDRNAIWGEIRLDLTALNDVEESLDQGDVECARSMRGRFERHSRLLDDLGWAKADSREEFPLTMPVQQLEQAVRWHRHRVLEELPESEHVDDDLDVLSACDHVLEQLA